MATAPRAVSAPPRRPARPTRAATANDEPTAADTGTREALEHYFLAIDTMGGGGGIGEPEQMATAIVTEACEWQLVVVR